MGIDSMRVGGGRCSLLIGGLLVACLIVICNWWIVSSDNIELARQIDDLNEQLKISVEERDQCVTQGRSLEQRYKHSEDEVASLHVRLEHLNELKKKNDELKDSITMYKTELDSLKKLDTMKTATLETLRLEKNTINVQLGAKKEENKKLQDEAKELKDQLAKAKLACNAVPEKKSRLTQEPTRAVFNKTQSDLVPESAVRVSVAGLRGLKYHGIPILPTDPPGAVRLSPRFSVTMLKAETSTKEQKNETQNESIDKENPAIGDTGNADDSNPEGVLGDDNLTEEAEKEQETKTKRTTEKKQTN